MNNALGIVAVLISFLILAMASRQIGALFARFRLPLISGFLFTGILVGPFVLGLLPKGVGEELRFVDEISLAIIAFAAGAELYLRELRSRMKSILWVTAGNVIAMNRLAHMLAAGRGSAPDPVKAATWHLIARYRGLSDLKLDGFLASLTDDQLKTAQKALLKWVAAHRVSP